MYVLISPNELLTQADDTTVQRVCEAVEVPFEVSKPLHWVEYTGELPPSAVGFINGEFVPLTYKDTSVVYNMPVVDFGAI